MVRACESEGARGVRWQVWSVAFSPDGRLIVSGDNAKTVTIWETSSRRKLGEMKCSALVRLRTRTVQRLVRLPRPGWRWLVEQWSQQSERKVNDGG